jgi:3',5'-cyclic AMP phosphodiesterase CpdA
MSTTPSLWAISDLHVSVEENRRFVGGITPAHPDDWLIIAGDIDEETAHVSWTFELMSKRFARVIWVPGNHELWTPRDEAGALRGQSRYDELVRLARSFGITTPEDEYLEWRTRSEVLTVVPLFILYDYSYDFAAPGLTKAQRLRVAERRGVVCSDEFLLHPDPYDSIEQWCAARLEYSRRRLDSIDPDRRTILINHFPLKARLTRSLTLSDFALWCGTTETSDWHLTYRSAIAVYGHLHIPITSVIDGVRFEEVALGYPRQRARMPVPVRLPRLIASGRAR